MVDGRRFHKQRVHMVLTAMRRFGRELEGTGFTVDYRKASSLRAGVRAHVAEHGPEEIVATEPNSPSVDTLLRELGVRIERSDQFLCHRADFATWAGGRSRLRLEDFYRWQRRRLGYLMDGDTPVGGRWNFDEENRQPPPVGGGRWPTPLRSRLDELDREVIAGITPGHPGAAPEGWWATSRRSALARLRHFIAKALSRFGTYEDAMTASSWHLSHSLLSPSLNIGLLMPHEVCDAVEDAYRSGAVPINAAEGMIRQVIGWREFVWGISWLWPNQGNANVLGNRRSLPPSWSKRAPTDLRCLQIALDGLHEHGWVHHIQRLMVLSNFANLYGMHPQAVRDWMREQYVDGADWVMGPNVMGMGMWADGGSMSSKPYVSGGAYINRMSDYCRDCRFDPTKRVGTDACPLTTLYWDFLDRHRDALRGNARMARQYATLDRLADLDDVRTRARDVIASIAAGGM